MCDEQLEDPHYKINKELNRIYSDMLKNSEPLPPEFQKVLNDNRWELYD